MSGWQHVRFGDVATLQRGFDLPVQDRLAGDIPIFAANGRVGSHNVARVKGPGVVTGRSGSIGKVHYVAEDFWPLNTALYVRDFHGNDPKYVSRLLQEMKLERYSTGTGVPTLNRNVVHEAVVLLPPLDQQRRIAAILDHSDVLCAKRRQILAHLDSLTQAVFSEMFASGTFEKALAGTLMPNMRNGLSPATAGRHSAQVLTLSAVTRGIFDPSAAKQGAFAIEPPPDKRVKGRDFLMCRGSGNKTLVGTGTFSREDRPDLVFPDTVIAGTADTALVTLPYLEAAWRRREVRAQIESVAQTTNGTYKVNQRSLAGIRVPLPPLDIQREFAHRVNLIEEERAVVARAAAVDDELFIALQAHAFRGDL